jgi:hypothetical protein
MEKAVETACACFSLKAPALKAGVNESGRRTQPFINTGLETGDHESS